MTENKAQKYIESLKNKKRIAKKAKELYERFGYGIQSSCSIGYEDGYLQCIRDIEHLAEEVDSLRETVKELKSHCKAVDDVNAKMKCFLNCKNYVKCTVNLSRPTPEHCRKCDKWELAE